MMDTANIRKLFVDFFKSKKHTIVPSAPMVQKNDPTLLFVNAGMNQFKDIFLGQKKPENICVANSQKCLRVSGKHNDLEAVGKDTYHHTFFEMLGNWSFGDYFKQEAIAYAWEFLTKECEISPERLYVTYFEGDISDNLEADTDSLNFWKKHIDESRILKGNKKDNFWEMGDTGPCGPCSEIHVDIRPDNERAKISGKALVNNDHPQVIEIWNLVFIQYNRKTDGSLHLLPQKHVDTGMGLERLAMVLQGKLSNYDTDIFQALIKKIEQITQKTYGKDETIDIAMRVMADHIRTIAFAIADGQLPANVGAGYVIRRILRRAVRYAYSFLGADQPVLCHLLDTLNNKMGNAFAEIVQQKELIKKVVLEEEQSFLRTLSKGIQRFEMYVNADKNLKLLSGKFAFELYDTYGFPVDLTELLCHERDIELDKNNFDIELKKQKDRSRLDSKIESEDWVDINSCQTVQTEFVGYDVLSSEIKIQKYRKVQAKNKIAYQVIFDKTPFYAESGGQVGDSGYLVIVDKKWPVINTIKENETIIHVMPKMPEQDLLNGTFEAVVDKQKRMDIARNHTATHILHYVLQQVLGQHVEQKGSLVHNDYLRFDFSHFQKLTEEELLQIEKKVNDLILDNVPLKEYREIPIEDAKNMGAMALFGEKYGNKVRVIKFASSVELCGGTHVKFTGNIGSFFVLSESSVAAGIRRIEAISGTKAYEYSQTQLLDLKKIKLLFNNPKDLQKQVNQVLNEKKELEQIIQKYKSEQIKQLKQTIKDELVEINGVPTIVKEVDLDANSIKTMLFELKNELPAIFGLLINNMGKKVGLSIVISDNIVTERGLHAGKIIKELAKIVRGGGGGQPFFATAGGSDASKIDLVKNKALEIIKGTSN